MTQIIMVDIVIGSTKIQVQADIAAGGNKIYDLEVNIQKFTSFMLL